MKNHAYQIAEELNRLFAEARAELRRIRCSASAVERAGVNARAFTPEAMAQADRIVKEADQAFNRSLGRKS